MISTTSSTPTGVDPIVTRTCLELAETMLRGVPSHEVIRHVESAAVRWARAGIPIDSVYREMCHSIKDASSREGDDRLVGFLVDSLTSIMSTVSTAYLGESRDQQSVRRKLADALFTGGTDTIIALGRECGVPIAGAYAVVVLTTSQSSHKLTRIVPEIARRCGESAIVRLSRTAGTAFVPEPVEYDFLEQLFGDLCTTTGTSLTAAMTSAPMPDIADAVHQAHELLDVALYFGHPGRLYRLSDLAAEYQLVRPGPCREHLAAILDPLEETPHLAETLLLYLFGNRDRKAIARRLHVHVNTLDYRLKRIADLTGFNPLTSDGQWHLRCALVARRRVEQHTLLPDS